MNDTSELCMHEETYIDDQSRTRCSSCGIDLGGPITRYWVGKDPESFTDEDWEAYDEIDWS